MTYGEVGAQALRAENVDSIVKGFALQQFTMRQNLMIQTSGAWSESYYRESKTELSATAKVARLAAFPMQSPIWEKNTAYLQKHGLEADISWEDVMTDNIPVLARTQLRITRAITKSEDDLIYTTLSGATGVLTTAVPATQEWDCASRVSHPQDAIGNAIEAVRESNYEPDTLLVNPHDFNKLVTNDDILDAFQAAQNNVMQNGVMGNLLGLKVVVSNSVTADQALVLESKTCGTLRVAEDVRTETIQVPGIKYTVRGWVISVPFVTDPESICKITNTQA